ncbi:MAG: gliding motility-associated C-terminal domain-containing protein, partial [Saprospiraceae bacterium]|nr:gliding motility-associated C-terminal domain-containing protein [Saprospiraceae bacterium]
SYTIVPTVSNFSGALSYQWSNGATSSINPVTINATQSYALTVSDASGCSGTASTSIGMNSNPSVNLPTSLDVCQFNAVTIDTKLSTISNTFTWSTGSTASVITLTPTASTNVSVTVTNASKCKSVATVSLNVRSNPSVSLPTSQIICANTPFTLIPAVSGGTPGYEYLWSNGSTNAALTTSLSISGAISLRVKDQKGCIATAISGITLIPNPTISISGIFDICPGQSTTLTALPSGGTFPYKFKWNTGDTSKFISIMPLIPTTYKITLTDKNNCVGEGSILVSTTKSISVTLPSDSSICLGDSIIIKPIIGTNGGDLNFLWNNGNTDEFLLVKPLSNSKYTLLVKDKLGCSGYAESTVNINTPPKATLPAIINGCLADSVKVNLSDISGTGPFNFNWSNGKKTPESTFFVDSDDIIFITITDVNQCKTIISSKIIGNEKPVLNLNAAHTYCLNESVRINPKVTGGLAPYSYLWSNGSRSAEFNTPLTENTNLTLVVSDKMGCTDKKSTFIELKKEIPQIFLPDTIRGCIGDEVLINPIIQDKVGISSYQWSDGQTKSQIIKNVLNSFKMKLQVMNLIGCIAVDSLLILPFNKPNIVLPSIFEACKSDKVFIEIPSDPDNRTTYQWNTGERSNKIDVFANESKLLKVWATNLEGCKDSAIAQLKIFENPTVSIIGKKENCSNTPASFAVDILSGNSPYQIKWASGETTSQVDYPTVDSIQKVGVEVTDVKGCRTFSSLPLTLLKGPDIQILSEFFVCENEEKALNPMVTLGKKPYIYSWNTNQSSPGILVKNGLYTFSVTDANRCTNRKDIKVTPIKPPELYVSLINQPSCNLPNGKIVLQIKSTSPTEVTWSNGQKGLLLENAYAGKYIAAAIDSNNCFAELSQNLVCNCEGKVGVMDENMVSICKNEVKQSKYDTSNQKIGLNNGRWFILHNSPGINLGNQILNMDTTGIIKYYQGMIVGETYYLSAVIGKKLSDGSLDLNDPCLSISPGTPVKILPTPETPIKISVSDTLVCPGSSIILQTNKQDNGFIYIWQTPTGFINTLTPSLIIPKFEKQDIGNYYLRINSEKCTSNAFGPIPINFSKEINEIFTEPDKSICGKDSVFISANMPLNANGKWLTGSSAIIGDPQNENTWVKGLIPGENDFLWTVVTRNCIITDTLKIYYVPRPKLKNDTVYLDDNKNTALFDFLENDELSNIPPSFLRINLISKPLSGNLFINKDGYFTYSRDPNISEDQSYSFVYEVCNTDTTGNCTNNCNLAEVILNVTYNPRTLIYPTIGLRPNFNNPVWKFEAARPMYSAKLNILDRWGKVVFKEEFLQLQKGEIVGNWNGLSQNQLKLPAGAYYFSLIGEIENNEKVVQNGIIYLME